MSNHFNKSNIHTNNHENRQSNPKNFNNMNPNTVLIITKAKRRSNLNKESDINNIKPILKEQAVQKLNSNKKTKNTFRDSNASNKKSDINPKTVINKSTKKPLHKNNIFLKNNLNQNNDINIIKDENNEIITHLKNKSVRKNNNNILKNSINLNVLNYEQQANKIEENEVKKLLDKPSNPNSNKELFKINEEENNSEFNLKIKLKPKEKNEIEKETEKNQNSKNSDNNKINNVSDKAFKRSNTKKPNYQSIGVFVKERPLFKFEKKNSLKLSSKELGAFRNSLRDSALTNSIFFIDNSINNIVIPMRNQKKENNCFLNVIIQNLTHLQNFKNDLLGKDHSDIYMKSQPVNDFYTLINLYQKEQIKQKDDKSNKDNKDTTPEPTLSVNNLRTSLNEVFGRYHKGESGDPMETMNSIFDLIHEGYCQKNRIDKARIKSCKCIVHKHFFLQLADIQYCPNCNSKKVQLYDKDCFMYNIFIKDILNKLHKKSFTSFKMKLFQILKEHNKTFEEKKKPKIPGCNCSEKLMESYLKTTKLMGPISTYLIINITWAEEFPSMYDILKTYMLLPVNEKIHNLFTFDKAIRNLVDYTFSIKGIILFGIYHYVCALYIKDENRWAVVDDKTIKYIDKYYVLIDSLLRNHLMPVGVIYSKDENDSLNESTTNYMNISKDEYAKLYQFCRDVDKRRGLKTSEIFQSKISFDEDKGDYINNNLFYNIFDASNDAKKTQDLINTIIIPNDKKEEKKKEAEEKNDKEKNTFKGGIFSFTKKFGNNFNLRGGIIDFSADSPEKEEENKKEENDWLNIGNNYEE